MCKHLSAHYTSGMLYFVDNDACESILDKFLSIFSTLKVKVIESEIFAR